MDQLTFDLACKTAYSMETAAKDASAFREKTIHAVQETEPARCFRYGFSIMRPIAGLRIAHAINVEKKDTLSLYAWKS